MPRTSKTPPTSEPPSSLALFLLEMAQAGLSTTYELQKETGLSVGATSPTIADLGKRGWLTVEKGSRKFRITEEGRRELDSRKAELEQTGRVPVQSVLRLPQPTSLDPVFGKTANLSLDSSLRILFFLWLWQPESLPTRGLQSYAESTSDAWHSRQNYSLALADHIWTDIQIHIKRENWQNALPKMYRWMKLQSDAALFEAQGRAIKKIAELVEKVEPPR